MIDKQTIETIDSWANENIKNFTQQNRHEIISFIDKHNLKLYEHCQSRPVFFTHDKKYSLIECSKTYYNSLIFPKELKTYALYDNFIVSRKIDDVLKDNIRRNFIIFQNTFLIIDEEIIVKTPNIYSYCNEMTMLGYEIDNVDDYFVSGKKENEYCHYFYLMNKKFITNEYFEITPFNDKNIALLKQKKKFFTLRPFENSLKQIKKIDVIQLITNEFKTFDKCDKIKILSELSES